MPSSPSKRRRPLPCPWCTESFKTIQGFRAHIRKHQRSQRDPISPLRNKLLSRRSNVDDDNGVFEFDDILGDAEIATCTEIVPEPDDDSYYSDYAYDCEYEGNNDLSSSSDENDNDDSSDPPSLPHSLCGTLRELCVEDKSMDSALELVLLRSVLLL